MTGVYDAYPMSGQPPYLLLYNRGPWAGCLLVGCSAFFLVSCGIFALLFIVIVTDAVGDAGAIVVDVILAFCGLVVAGSVVFAIVHLSRPPMAWMEGTTVVVRGFFTTRRCDLAIATSIVIDGTPETRSVHHGNSHRSIPTGRMLLKLRAQQSPGDRNVILWLRHPNSHHLLEPPKLHALANAMLAGPQRPDPATHRWIERIAQGLREMADDPFADAR